MNQGAWLKGEIARAEYSVAGFARRLKMSRSQVKLWLTQDRLLMRAETMWKVLRALNLEEATRAAGHLRPERFAGLGDDPLEVLGQSQSVAGVFAALILYSAGKGDKKATQKQPSGVRPGAVVEDDDLQPLRRFRHEIPLAEVSLAAGPPVDVEELLGAVGENAFEQGLVRVRLAGDSMAGKYPNGCIVEFDYLSGKLDESHLGKNFYVQLSDGTATFKQLEDFTDEEIKVRTINRKKYPRSWVFERSTVVRMALCTGSFTPD